MLDSSHVIELRQTLHRYSQVMRKLVMGMATLFLIAGLVYSYRLQPQVLQGLHWQPIVLLSLLGVPLTLALNAIEFKLSARLSRVQISLLKALEVTVIGSAANMLPLPGSTIIRVAALKKAGATVIRGTSGTILCGIIWLAVAFSYAGILMRGAETGYISLLFIIIGCLALLSSLLCWYKLDGSFRLFGWIFITKLLLVLTDSARMYFCFAALGVNASFSQVSAFAVTGVLGSAVSIVPGGLGIREAVSAVISPIVGLAAAHGFMAAFINRMVGLAVITPLAIYLTSRKD